MKGCRALSIQEIEKIKDYFSKMIGSEGDKRDLCLRNKTLLFFSIYSGFRISEALSVKVKDVIGVNENVSSSVYLKKENTKGKKEGRTGILNQQCRDLLKTYLEHYHLFDRIKVEPEVYLFPSSKKYNGKRSYHLTSRMAGYIYEKIFNDLEMTGALATHTMRKTYASMMFKLLGNSIYDLKVAMGHHQLSSTESYIQANQETVNEAVDKMIL